MHEYADNNEERAMEPLQNNGLRTARSTAFARGPVLTRAHAEIGDAAPSIMTALGANGAY
jgi:hypothetical protein